MIKILSPLIVGKAETLAVSSLSSTLKFNFPSCGISKTFGSRLHIDFKGHVVTIDGKVLQLTPKEYELLTYFTNNIGVALSREELLNKIWDYNFFGDDRTVDTHIKMLRNNLGKYRDLIETVRGVGYKFETK